MPSPKQRCHSLSHPSFRFSHRWRKSAWAETSASFSVGNTPIVLLSSPAPHGLWCKLLTMKLSSSVYSWSRRASRWWSFVSCRPTVAGKPFKALPCLPAFKFWCRLPPSGRSPRRSGASSDSSSLDFSSSDSSSSDSPSSVPPLLPTLLPILFQTPHRWTRASNQ